MVAGILKALLPAIITIVARKIVRPYLGAGGPRLIC